MKTVIEKLKVIGVIIGFAAIDQGLLVVMMATSMYQSSLAFALRILLALAIFAGFVTYAQKKGLLDFKTIKPKSLILWELLGYALILLCNQVGIAFVQNSGATTTSNQAALEQLFTLLSPAFMGLFVVLIAPLIEELIFRYLIPKVLFKNYEVIGFIVGVLGFALVHGADSLGDWIIYGGMGAVMAFLYYKTERFEYSLTLHILNNAIAFALMMAL